MNRSRKQYPRDRLHVGDVRPSQMMFSYGIGSIVDLPNLSVIVTGLDGWRQDTPEIIEPRLLSAVRFYDGMHAVRALHALPRAEDESGLAGPQASDYVGVPVAIFPRWWVCPVCRTLAPLSSGIFERTKDTYPPERIRYTHKGCLKVKNPQAIPARILVACESGHLDDFPWVAYAHDGADCSFDKPILTLEELGVSGEARDLVVRCQCGKSKPLVSAFGRAQRTHMPTCTARRPHLRDYDPAGCELPMRAIALGASNLWFPITLDVLSIPTVDEDRLHTLIEQDWRNLAQVTAPIILDAFRKTGLLASELSDYDDDTVMAAIARYRERAQTPIESEEAPDLKKPEYERLINPDPRMNSADFQTRRVVLSAGWNALGISDVILVERLRTVQAMLGFARLDAVGELTDPNQQVLVRAAPITSGVLDWVPAAEERGEGLFFRFDEAALSDWEDRAQVREYQHGFFLAHKQWREKRGIQNPEGGFPGMRYVLLHSFSHALMRQMALSAGYNGAALQERIYARSVMQPGGPMSGVLIYTTAPDSDGTLGGLVGMGSDERALRAMVMDALTSMTLCASDPLCAERDIDLSGKTIHAAACHACLFAPETSCERGNRYLDRSVLVETIDQKRAGAAFFSGLE